MATSRRIAHRARGRQVPVRRKRPTLLILGGVMLLALGVIFGAVIVGNRPAQVDEAALAVASTEKIPNAEPFGRAWGPAGAPIKIEEYIDYQCPACGAYGREIEPEVVAAFAATGMVRYEIHNFQFKGIPSQNAAEGAYCAAEQDMFWPMHTSIYLNQPEGHGTDALYNDAQLLALASRLGMDKGAFQGCLTSNTYVEQVQADYQRAVGLNIQSTPTFVVNGQPFVGVQTVENFRQIFASVAPDVKIAP